MQLLPSWNWIHACIQCHLSLSLSLPCQLPPQPKPQTVKTPWSNFNLCIYLYIQPLSPSCSPNVLADTAGNMKSSAACMSLVLVAWAIASGLFSRPVTAEGPCPGSFFSALVQLYPCMPAVAPFGPMPPSKPCCNVVKNLGQPCLCEIIKGPQITGVDRSVAMQLPSKCEANFQPCNLPALSYNYNDNFFFIQFKPCTIKENLWFDCLLLIVLILCRWHGQLIRDRRSSWLHHPIIKLQGCHISKLFLLCNTIVE